jgi:hypothetical protein
VALLKRNLMHILFKPHQSHFGQIRNYIFYGILKSNVGANRNHTVAHSLETF